MLTVVKNIKNQLKVSFLTVKYALIREMINKTTFLTNITFMILNDASFILQWIVLYALKDNVGGYTFNQVLLLWGIAAGTYGFSHFFFESAFNLSDTINNGKLDAFLVQPKNVLISTITMSISASAIGDLAYAYIMLFVFGFTIKNFLLFTLFCFTGSLIIVSIAIILGSLSFWFNKSDVIADTGNSLLTNFATYPDGIFKGITKILFYTILPLGYVAYMPVQILSSFNIKLFILVISITIMFITLAVITFYRGLRRYSSSNLMIART